MSVPADALQSNGDDQGLPLEERKQQLEEMYRGYKQSFPQVHDITAAEVDELLSRPEPVVLVDVRTREEQEVSMIKGALTKAEFEKVKDRYKDATVITYCTAGARSGKYASQLEKEGFTHVQNMKGSLISWTHEALPLVAGDGSGEPTKHVHAFGPQWAALYAPGYETTAFANPLLKGAAEAVKDAFSGVFGARR